MIGERMYYAYCPGRGRHPRLFYELVCYCCRGCKSHCAWLCVFARICVLLYGVGSLGIWQAELSYLNEGAFVFVQYECPYQGDTELLYHAKRWTFCFRGCQSLFLLVTSKCSVGSSSARSQSCPNDKPQRGSEGGRSKKEERVTVFWGTQNTLVINVIVYRLHALYIYLIQNRHTH